MNVKKNWVSEMNKIELQETIKKWFNKKYKGYDFNIYYYEEVLGLDYPMVNIRIKNEIIDKGLQFCVYEKDVIKEIKENLLQPMQNIKREERLIRENLGLKKELSEMYKRYEKLEERAKPHKLIRLPITTHDELILPKYTYKIEKVMCDKCGLTSFVVDNHYSQFKFCKQCGQAVDWSDFE